MNTLTDQCVLVTGGGSGIGLAAARGFLTAGARVAIAGRNADKLRRAAEALSGGDRLIHHAADVSYPDMVHRLVDDVTKRLGRIDILVNNAGLNVRERSFRELTPARWDLLLAGNLNGAFHCIQAALPQMRERQNGLIINVNSIAGKRANPLGGIGYVAAKFGLRGLAMGVAAEEKPNGIRVSSIYPGEVDTPILEQRPSPLSEEHRRTILQPEDVAA
ncbi:MAG TPA: SDR family oxidoreductase, partial [Gemmataceae bacterium]|nr:SDR family oxidoreductase [Gemmataceae bacterium]